MVTERDGDDDWRECRQNGLMTGVIYKEQSEVKSRE